MLPLWKKWTDITCTNFRRVFLLVCFFFWRQAELFSSSLWCFYQTCWNIALNWGPVASISQAKWLFRFPVTLGHYHSRTPARILYLLPAYVGVLFISCGWNRGSVFPGCNPLSHCRKGALRALAASCCGPCEMGAVMLFFHIAPSWNNVLLLFKMGPFSKKNKESNTRTVKIGHFLSFQQVQTCFPNNWI